MTNQNLKHSIQLYSTKNVDALFDYLNGLSKPSLIALYIDVLTLYFNDKNSSKLRELTTLWVCGFQPNAEKLGYNGYKMNADTGERIDCEVKPQNTNDPKKKLNGGGSFNDYTRERFERDASNNPVILISGFVMGKLIYIFEIRFACLKARLNELLDKKFSERRREAGEYLRSASFTFKDYRDCSFLRLAYLRENWRDFRSYLSKDLVKYFEENTL